MVPDIDAGPVDFALYFAKHGVRILPLRPKGKEPRIKRWQEIASSDPDTITSWFDSEPEANYGILCNGLIVVDIDVRHGGHLWLDDNMERLPDTWIFRTGSGGQHLLYRAPEGVEVGNAAGIAPGVDIKSDRGQIVGPGSQHPNGNLYTIEVGPEDCEIAEAPAWLVDAILAHKNNGADPGGDIKMGARDEALTSIMGSLIRRYSEAEARRRVHEINHSRCKPPLAELQVDKIADSIAQREARKRDPEPGVLGDPFGKLAAPELPAGLLPPVLEAFAQREAETKGVVLHAPALAALTVCAAAITDAVEVRVKVHEEWTEAARLWVALIGPPSAKKSPVMRTAMAPLKRLQAAEAAEHKAAMRVWDKTNKDARGDAPVAKRYILNDATIEAAGRHLADNPHGLLLERDELSGWFGAMDKYSSGRGAAADRAFWLMAWNGGPYSVDRVSRGSIYLPNLSVSILGGIQPDAIRRIAADTVDDGLLQRLIPITVGSTGVGKDTPDQDHAFRDYADLVERLTELKPQRVRFLAEGHEIRKSFEIYADDLGKLETISPQLGAFCGKLPGLFARLCLIFHACEPQPLGEYIGNDVASRVDRLLRSFVVPHTLRFYLEILGENSTMSDARSIAGFILAHTLDRITLGRLKRDCWPCRKADRQQILGMVDPLVILEWLIPDDPILPRAWAVNPEVHKQFAKIAENERKRRSTVRRLIIEGNTDDQTS